MDDTRANGPAYFAAGVHTALANLFGDDWAEWARQQREDNYQAHTLLYRFAEPKPGRDFPVYSNGDTVYCHECGEPITNTDYQTEYGLYHTTCTE
jgi:hypothetical protein